VFSAGLQILRSGGAEITNYRMGVLAQDYKFCGAELQIIE
jgi:hypothetical protein